LTLVIVVFTYLLSTWNLWVATLSTAPLFGDIPSRDAHIEGGMAALTGVLACLVIAFAAWIVGSRWGLLLLGLPALILFGVAVSMLDEPGDPRDPSPGRALVPTDAFSEYTQINWVVSCVAILCVGIEWIWRRGRH
jgi:hypothetical protein